MAKKRSSAKRTEKSEAVLGRKRNLSSGEAGPISRMSQGTAKLAGRIFPIVGVGAPAGELEASSQLLKNLPSQVDLALVLIQHLDPTYKSMLTELLSKTTTMPVEEVRDAMRNGYDRGLSLISN